MSDSKSSSGGGIGFLGLLCVLFIGLKLTGHIAWSWWWIMAPVWIPITLALIVLGIAGIIYLIAEKN